MVKAKVAATVFELPQRLGILQYVEYERCSGCLYTGLLTAEGCKRGVCVRYRVWVSSRDGRRWEAGERRRNRRDEEGGGCLRQQTADALWELAERYDVAVDGECNIVINGVAIPRPRCRAVEECVRQMLEEYKKRLESPPPPLRRGSEEEYEVLLQQYPWLGWWRKDAVLDALKRYKQSLLDVLQRFNKPEIPHFVAAFTGRFELDFRCVVDVYRGTDSYCVSFCVKDLRPVTYCYERGKGWHAAQQPKFMRLKPLPDGQLVETYVLEGKELVRVA